MSVPYRIARLEAPEACEMPVRPCDGDCQPPRLGEPDRRTERCATDAWWRLGDLSVCDQHLRVALLAIGDTYDEMLERYRRRVPAPAAEQIPTAAELVPWAQRPRRPDRARRPASGSLRWRRSPGGRAAARAMPRRAGR